MTRSGLKAGPLKLIDVAISRGIEKALSASPVVCVALQIFLFVRFAQSLPD